jgi:hypothetical protein
MKGEQNVLFPDKILMFVVTSGTSGDAKYFPLGERRVEELVMDGFICSTYYLVHSGNYHVMEGVSLALVTAPKLGQKVGPYDVAFFSGAMTNVPTPPSLQSLRRGDRTQRVPPREVDAISDWAEKFYVTARYAVAEDIRMCTGETSKIVSQMRKIHLNYYDRLLADPELDEKTKAKLRRVSTDGVVDLQELWPDFQVITSSGVSLTPYKRQIHNLFGDIDIWEMYGATEVSMGTMVYLDKGIIPMMDRTFFEFIPDEEEDAIPIPLSDVKTGVSYRTIITNNGGFYRYDLGDLVTFTELDPPVFGEISRKKALVSVVGERTSEELLLRALDRVCEEYGTAYTDFALLPEITEETIRYHLYVEFTQLPADLDEFASEVDRRLGMASFVYSIKRKQKVFSQLVVIPVQPGGFEKLLLKLGKDPGIHKVPRLLTPELERLVPKLV